MVEHPTRHKGHFGDDLHANHMTGTIKPVFLTNNLIGRPTLNQM